jgi:uncharacterized protein
MDESRIAAYLLDTPDFFDRHAELLSDIQLISPHGKRAVSLQERQIELQRDKTKSLELKLADMLRYAQENDALQNKLLRWVRTVLMHNDESSLPEALVEALKAEFAVPFAAIKLWGAYSTYASQADALWCKAVSADVMSFAASMTQPFCGPNTGYEAAQWLGESDAAKSLALIALKPAAATGYLPDCYGLLVLGSPDAERFRAGMGTAFLQRIGEVASAATARLIAPVTPAS